MHEFLLRLDSLWPRTTRGRVLLLAVTLPAIIMLSIFVEDNLDVSSDAIFRVVSAVVAPIAIYPCLAGPDSRWMRFGLVLALAVNMGIFFTPLVDRPAASRGEFFLFALPSLVVMLSARVASFPVQTARDRVVRQQLILGLVVSVLACATGFIIAIAEARSTAL